MAKKRIKKKLFSHDMRHSTKLIYNTVASYARIIVNTLVTLFATRLALKYLGADDFGLYNLIAGIVVMLSFINGSLLVSAQRFFSIAIGEKNEEKLKRYFNASLGIHIIIAVVVSIILFAITPLLFNGFLKISPDKLEVGKVIYYLMIISTAITLGTLPYSSAMNAHEDLVALSVCAIITCFIRMLAAVSLIFIDDNLLLVYTLITLASVVVNMLIEMGWCRLKYKESKVVPSLLINKPIYKEMMGFIGWNTLGSMAVVVRNQGVAVVLNFFFGTLVNAAYGIANHVNALVLSFSTTLTTVFTPTIIQAKGARDEKKMMITAIFSSKLAFFLSSAMALPILLFLKEILDVWLDEYPDTTLEFCSYIVLTFLVMQLYPGINRAIYANGQIKGYQIAIAIALVSIIPVGAFFFQLGYPAYSIMIVMLFFQIMTLVATIYYGHKLCNLDVKDFVLHSVLVPVLVFSGSLFVFHYFLKLTGLQLGLIGIVVYTIVLEIIYMVVYGFVVLNKTEKGMLMGLINKRRKQ